MTARKEQRQRGSMTRTSLCNHVVTAALLLVLICQSVDSQRTDPCPNNPAISGYITVENINLDIQDAVDSVANGTDPVTPYLYPLCPDTTLLFNDGDAPIQPRLDASFSCGIDGTATGCEIRGGTTQFLLQADAAFKDFGLSNVTITGIRFTGFTEASVAIFGSEGNTAGVLLDNCEWTDFTSQFIVNISSTSTGDLLDDGPEVVMRDGMIRQGTAGTGLANNRGLLAVNNLDITAMVMTSGIRTDNGGLSSLEGLVVTASSIPMVVGTYSLSMLFVDGAAITGNADLKEVFFFESPPVDPMFRISTVGNVTFTNNDMVATGWTGVFVSMGISVLVADCQFSNNRNMETGVTASEMSTVSVSTTEFANNFGTSPNVSALVLAISDATAEVDEVAFRGNTNFTSQVFTIFRSALSLSSSCIIGGGSDTVIFVSQDSTFAGVNASTNFVTDHSSAACNSAGSNRLFFEDAGSMCFQGGDCTGTCRDGASSPSCVLDGTTAAPTLAPEPTTTAPVGGTVAPATAAPIGGTVFPATSAPIGETSAPATAAPVGGTVAPATSAPVGGTIAPATSAPVGGTVAPVVAPTSAAPVAGTASPITIAPVATPVTVAPVVAPGTIAPVGNTLSPVTVAPVAATALPTTASPVASPPTPAPTNGGTPPVTPQTPFPVAVPTATASPFSMPIPSPTPFPVVTPSNAPVPSPNMPSVGSPVYWPTYYQPTCDSGKGKKGGKKGGKSCKSASRKGKKGNYGKSGGKKGKKGGYSFSGSSNAFNGGLATGSTATTTSTNADTTPQQLFNFGGSGTSQVQTSQQGDRTPLTSFPGFRSGHRKLEDIES